jgi:hypothetical protein
MPQYSLAQYKNEKKCFDKEAKLSGKKSIPLVVGKEVA